MAPTLESEADLLFEILFLLKRNGRRGLPLFPSCKSAITRDGFLKTAQKPTADPSIDLSMNSGSRRLCENGSCISCENPIRTCIWRELEAGWENLTSIIKTLLTQSRLVTFIAKSVSEKTENVCRRVFQQITRILSPSRVISTICL